MGQKINVNLFRAKKKLSNVTNTSADATALQTSVWFAKGKTYSTYLLADREIKIFLRKELQSSGLVNVVVRRYFRKVEISIFVTRPGLVIGKAGATINALKAKLIKMFKLPEDLKLDIAEYRDPYRSANVIAEELSDAVKRGAAYRKLAKGFLEKVKYSGIQGCKITVAGRLNGAEIARSEHFGYGSVPRHTIDANIDYAAVPCKTKAGILGIKVWLFKGDKFNAFNA
ncbi:MAG: 30S ribosomal protein S3 [Candidatus Parcubacteria bacterium]|nr:30S ribosomal protein S3 [Candidatus Paceibacterota bacterium]